MATKAIGSGTVNMALNVPQDERSFWGRLTTEMGKQSIAQLQRAMLMDGLERLSMEKAAQLREIRMRYYGTAMLVLLCASLAHAVLAKEDEHLRRARAQRIRTVRVVRLGRAELEVAA